MRELITRALNAINSSSATYGDIRVTEIQRESLDLKNGLTEKSARFTTFGFGVRVIVNGAWGFAASSKLTAFEIDRIIKEAIDVAQASATVMKEEVKLAEVKPVKTRYTAPYKKNPFDVPIEDKQKLLAECCTTMLAEKDIKIAEAFYSGHLKRTIFASSEGAFIEQEIIECGGGIAATAIKDSEIQVRSYPNSFRGNFATCGYEFLEEMDLPGNAARVASEAAQLLVAPDCPQGRKTIILDGGQLALQVHESIGHPTELDRVLGMEASYAGTSFLTIDDIDHLQYGSEIVNVVADATVPRGLGTFAYDDEGVSAQKVYLIKDGVFRGFQSSRETAVKLNLPSSGGMRAESWAYIPLVRMTNINLLPGKWELDDLIADTDDGLFMATDRSWSIDDKRINFKFGPEIAYEIKNGKLGRIFKNPSYTGITTEFWKSCDAICSEKHWMMWGTPNCGKGQPGQVAHVGHGTAPARFRNVEVQGI